jgi:hypothetical protein
MKAHVVGGVLVFEYSMRDFFEAQTVSGAFRVKERERCSGSLEPQVEDVDVFWASRALGGFSMEAISTSKTLRLRNTATWTWMRG